MGREASRLLAEVAPVGRPGGADRLAESLGSEMAIALLDRHGIGVDDEIARFVLPRSCERRSRRSRAGEHCGAVEILAPAFIGGLEQDDPSVSRLAVITSGIWHSRKRALGASPAEA